MPVTPFHLIAASPIKAIIPRKFSWTVFCLTNILLDLEPIFSYLVTLEPRHMFLHSIVGATLVAIFSATYGRRICEIAIDIWNGEIKENVEAKWLTFDTHISKAAAWCGALIGAWSHLLLDSFMHDDIKPLSPFTNANTLLGTISIGWLHTVCFGLGLIGFIWLVLKRR